MYEGLICDACGKRLAAMRIKAEVEVPPSKGVPNPEPLIIEQDLCEICLKTADNRILRLLHCETYPTYYVPSEGSETHGSG